MFLAMLAIIHATRGMLRAEVVRPMTFVDEVDEIASSRGGFDLHPALRSGH